MIHNCYQNGLTHTIKVLKMKYEDGYKDGLQSKEKEIIDMLDNMDLEEYDYHTISAIKQMIKREKVTH